MGNHGPEPSQTARALAEGARRSREAQDPGSPAPSAEPSPVAPAPAAHLSPSRPAPLAAFVARHKWKLVGLLFLLLTELCLLFLGKGLVMGPG